MASGNARRLSAFLALAILVAMTQPAMALLTARWYFGTNLTGQCDNPGRWYDSDGTTLLATGVDAQLIWVGPDGTLDGIDTATCDPANDDVFVTDHGGLELNTIDIYHDPPFPYDGVGDGVFAFCNPKEGRFRGDDTLDTSVWDGRNVHYAGELWHVDPLRDHGGGPCDPSGGPGRR